MSANQNVADDDLLIVERARLVVNELIIMMLLGALIADKAGFGWLLAESATEAGVPDGVMQRALWLQETIGNPSDSGCSEEQFANICQRIMQVVDQAAVRAQTAQSH